MIGSPLLKAVVAVLAAMVMFLLGAYFLWEALRLWRNPQAPPSASDRLRMAVNRRILGERLAARREAAWNTPQGMRNRILWGIVSGVVMLGLGLLPMLLTLAFALGWE